MPFLDKKEKYQKYLILILSVIPVIIHLYTNLFAGYGIFRDELYYIACSERLDFGYVDHPPFSIGLLYLNNLILGNSVFAIRLLPSLFSGLTVFLVCNMVIKLGGRFYSIILAAFAVILAPIYFGFGTVYSMNFLDVFLWTLSFYLLLFIIKSSRQYYWILLGIVMGIGLMNKIGFLWFITGLTAGLLLTEKRKEFLTLKPYVAYLISLTIFLPYLIWNYQNNFAHIEFIRNAVSEKYSSIGIFDFISGQFLILNPVASLIWIPGIYFFLSNKEETGYRIPAIIYLTAALILLINGHSKAEYLSASYTILFAGGAVFIEKRTLVRLRWIRPAILSLLIITGILLAPLALPVLPVNTFIAYSNAIGITHQNSEGKNLSELPQFYADMHGWEKMAENVSKVYQTLPREDRLNTIIYGRNYGEAASMEYFKNKYPIPRAISSHNSYWLWGYGFNENPIVIIIGGNRDDHLRVFEQVEEALIHEAEYSMPYENNIPIYIARNIKVPLNEIWNEMKHYE